MNKQLLTLILLLLSFFCRAQCFNTISPGQDHSLAVKTGTLWGWGRNDEGQLAANLSVGQYSVATQIGNDNDWIVAVAGHKFSMALKSNGSLWAWGDNQSGVLGQGNFSDKITPTQVGTDLTWQQIAAGEFHAIAVKADGTLWAWGSNGKGELGVGSAVTSSTVPLQVGTDNNWQSVSVAGRRTMAIKTDGSIYVWGDNSSGQLGINSVSNVMVPFFFDNVSNWKKISISPFHSLGIKDDDTLWAWGNNSAGQVGDATLTNRLIPTQISALTIWKEVSAGGGFSLAVNNTGNLFSWGFNSVGQLGQGNFSDKNVPTLVNNASDWDKIYASSLFSFGQKSSGSLFAWGYNIFSQLGDGTFTSKNVPTLVSCESMVATEQFNKNAIRFYPNPVNDKITILADDVIKSIKIIDVQGRVLTKQDTHGNDRIELDLSSLPGGYYFFEIVSENGKSKDKFIKL